MNPLTWNDWQFVIETLNGDHPCPSERKRELVAKIERIQLEDGPTCPRCRERAEKEPV